MLSYSTSICAQNCYCLSKAWQCARKHGSSRCWIFLKSGSPKQSSLASKLCLKPEAPLSGFFSFSLAFRERRLFRAGLINAGFGPTTAATQENAFHNQPFSEWILQGGARAVGAGGCCLSAWGDRFCPPTHSQLGNSSTNTGRVQPPALLGKLLPSQFFDPERKLHRQSLSVSSSCLPDHAVAWAEHPLGGVTPPFGVSPCSPRASEVSAFVTSDC